MDQIRQRAYTIVEDYEFEQRYHGRFRVEGGRLLAYKGEPGQPVLELPEQIRSIGKDAIHDVSEVICKGVVEVRDYAFYGMGLERIVFSGDIRKIGSGAFGQCKQLREVVFSQGSEAIEVEEGAFYGCEKLEKLVFPSHTKTHGKVFGGVDYNFLICDENCSTVYYVPRSLKDRLFQKSPCLPKTIRNIADSVFENSQEIQEIQFPPELSTIGKRAFYRCGNLERIVIPENTVVEQEAFAECRKLNQIQISGTTKRIANGAFRGCPGTIQSDEQITIRERMRLTGKPLTTVPWELICSSEDDLWNAHMPDSERKQFEDLRIRCSLGDVDAMILVSDYFQNKSGEKSRYKFNHCARNFWIIQTGCHDNLRTAGWLDQYLEMSGGQSVPVALNLEDEYDVYSGAYLLALGLPDVFKKDYFYSRFCWSEKGNVILCAFRSFCTASEFSEDRWYRWLILDSFFHSIPGIAPYDSRSEERETLEDRVMLAEEVVDIMRKRV